MDPQSVNFSGITPYEPLEREELALMQQSSQCSLPMSAYVKGRG